MKEIQVTRRLLSENDQAAAGLRQEFLHKGTLVVNLISSPGAGKTTLLEATVSSLAGSLKLAAIVGDIATERDADRLRRLGVPAKQIITGGACHLDARQVRTEVDGRWFGDTDILFIENVGNLVCPTSYDLGEDFKVVLLSVTEGEDKPFKYPGIFSRAAVTIVSKVDLLPHVDFDLDAVRSQVRTLNPEAELLLVSAKTGEGLREWQAFLVRQLEQKRHSDPAAPSA